MNKKIFLVVLPLLLSGCVNIHQNNSLKDNIKDNQIKNKTSNLKKINFLREVEKIRKENFHSSVIENNKHPTFNEIVSRLQNLNYLPLTHASIHTLRNGKFIILRHDFFKFNVPQPLENTVNKYKWNSKNPFIRSAIIQFERQNNILGPLGVSEGNLHPAVMKKLFSKTAIKNNWSFQWVYVTKGSGTTQPEQLHIWEEGVHSVPKNFGNKSTGFIVRNSWVWGTLINTGVLGSTPNGTYPIYQRLPKTTMQGVFPIPISASEYNSLNGDTVPQWAGSNLRQSARGIVNGNYVRWQPYKDPGILWVNYFDRGRGIHYYPRESYGFPQSAGCVEEPYNSAPITYKILHYGVPVTISSQVFKDKNSAIR